MSLVTLAALSGCGAGPLPDEADEESSGVTQDALTTENALTVNAMTANALTLNALTANAMTLNALTLNAMTLNAIAAIQAPTAQGDLNRELLRYIVACALKPNQSFDFTWTDSGDAVHDEHYVGQLGLAPKWAKGRLDKDGQEMVSACLAAKVNFYGVQVTISVRSGEKPLKLHPHNPELDDYPNIEGAFWGNLWASQPYLNACYMSSNVDNSRDQQRDCAAGHVLPDGSIEQCGIIDIVGSCSSVCKKFNSSRGYYEDCKQKPGVSHKRTDNVITTSLL
ncbi:MAG: hypothetical protein IPM54_32625 [Polyangiaceae bacterium]|nr:hypothetical protein [Polyangiaceae bacterium]